MVEHDWWVGDAYKDGIADSRIAILGYSHYVDDDSGDHAAVTHEVVSKVISGEYQLPFFTKIRNFFGCHSHKAFWQHVAFMNYLPNSVGRAAQRYDYGTQAQINHASERFTKMLWELSPQKVLIFSKKVRWVLPDIELRPLGPDLSDCLSGATTLGPHHVKIYSLRHPQGARNVVMRETVARILSDRVAG